jgi:hypothetical protein
MIAFTSVQIRGNVGLCVWAHQALAFDIRLQHSSVTYLG